VPPLTQASIRLVNSVTCTPMDGAPVALGTVKLPVAEEKSAVSKVMLLGLAFGQPRYTKRTMNTAVNVPITEKGVTRNGRYPKG